MTDREWHPDLVRTALPQAVLSFLEHGPRHGYQLRDELRQAGFVNVKGGTLYPMLTRLEDQAFVDHRWQHDTAGPARKIYSLTTSGRVELERSRQAWQAMTDVLHSIATQEDTAP